MRTTITDNSVEKIYIIWDNTRFAIRQFDKVSGKEVPPVLNKREAKEVRDFIDKYLGGE